MHDTPARLMAETIARAKAQARQHETIAALLRASLDELRRSESLLEQQLGELRQYLGHEGLGPETRIN
ncbi:MAG: hypothetical protein RL735_709 [Pseudomonadota bacterium]